MRSGLGRLGGRRSRRGTCVGYDGGGSWGEGGVEMSFHRTEKRSKDVIFQVSFRGTYRISSNSIEDERGIHNEIGQYTPWITPSISEDILTALLI